MKRSGPIQRRSWWPRRRNKFNARPVHNLATGESFDSISESAAIGRLRLLERAGLISNVEVHPQVVLLPARGKAKQIAWRLDAAFDQDGRRVWYDWKPRPMTDRERLLMVLWAHNGPGLLRIDKGRKGLETVMPEGQGQVCATKNE